MQQQASDGQSRMEHFINFDGFINDYIEVGGFDTLRDKLPKFKI